MMVCVQKEILQATEVRVHRRSAYFSVGHVLAVGRVSLAGLSAKALQDSTDGGYEANFYWVCPILGCC